MAPVFTKAYYTPPKGAEIDMTRFMNLDEQRGLDLKSAKGTLIFNNSPFRDKTAGNSIFVEDGVFELYVDYNPITRSSDQLLLSGQIRELKPTFGSNGSQYNVTVADRTVLLLGGLWSKTYATDGTHTFNSPTIIKDVIGQVAHSITTNNVTTSTTTSSTFPMIDIFGFSFKPVYDWISELSQPGYTGEDRAYLFYVDKDNDCHWFYPSQTVAGSIIEGSTPIYNASLNRNSDSIINVIIYNAGVDLRGNGILWYYVDLSSQSNTARMKFQPMTDIARDTIRNEIIAGNLIVSSSGEVPFQGLLFTGNNSYVFTTTWGVDVNNLSTYNEAFRTYCKLKGNKRSDKITKQMGKLLWNGSVTLRGTHNYTSGDLISYTSATLGLKNYLLRIVDISHGIGKEGWKTTLQLKEDEQAITASDREANVT